LAGRDNSEDAVLHLHQIRSQVALPKLRRGIVGIVVVRVQRSTADHAVFDFDPRVGWYSDAARNGWHADSPMTSAIGIRIAELLHVPRLRPNFRVGHFDSALKPSGSHERLLGLRYLNPLHASTAVVAFAYDELKERRAPTHHLIP
jgi:hypothetical protein